MTTQQTFRNTVVVLATIALAYAMLLSIRILIVLLIAIIVASAVRPAVLWLKERRIPEGLALLMVYGLLAIGIFGMLAIVLPPALERLAGYIENEERLATRIINAQSWFETTIERYIGDDVTLFDPEGIRTTVGNTVVNLRETVPAMAGEFGGLFGDFILVVVMGIYWITSRDQAVEFVNQLFPLGRRAMVAEIITEIERSMGAYLRGIVLVATSVGIANYVLLRLFNVPNAVTLAFIIGITTGLPIIGGFIGAGVAVLLALLIGEPIHALLTFLSFVLVQQVENHYLTPRMMSRSVNLNPILVIVFLFVGFALGGVIGGLIAVPIAGTIMLLLRYLVLNPRREESTPQRVEGGILLTPDVVEVAAAKAVPTTNKPVTTGK